MERCGTARHRVAAGIRSPRGARLIEKPIVSERTQSPKGNSNAARRLGDNFREDLIDLIPFLRAFAHTLCRGRDDADDLAQESIAKAWQARASFQRGTNLKAWLIVIQRNAFLSAKRRNWREVDWNPAVIEPILVTQGAQQPGAELADLRRAMTLLPHDQHEALILVGAAGFTYREAASICGCAVGTMKSRVSRARQAVVSLMDGKNLLHKSSERDRAPALEIFAASDVPQGS
jgi:RNA polymerase sigma-70 factor (ECF subfamily)